MRLTGPHVAGALALALATVAAVAPAAADWYFTWHCQGACAADAAGVDGTEGPFATEADCDRAMRDKRWQLNASPGSAGTAGACYQPGGGGGGAPTGAFERAAVFARLHVGALYGGPWAIEYEGGRAVDVGPTTGAEVAVSFGREAVGLAVGAGLLRAPGARELPSDPLDPIWAASLTIGVTSSPFAIVRRPRLEVRPDLGVDFGDLQRVSCERCAFTVARKSEPDSTLIWRVRVGVDVPDAPGGGFEGRDEEGVADRGGRGARR